MENRTVLRVGVYNNFNFTEEEIQAVREYEENYLPFVNSNSFVTIRADYPSILTINPYLDSWQPPVGDLSNVKACRVKWVEGAIDKVHQAQIEAIHWCVDNSIPILITFMRFASKNSLRNYVSLSASSVYQFDRSYYRLPLDKASEVVIKIGELVQAAGGSVKELVYACDLQGKGCPSCGNCARLTYGISDSPVQALTLSCSGDAGACIFHCPDCWAQRMAKVAKFKYDTVTMNSKQRGKKSE